MELFAEGEMTCNPCVWGLVFGLAIVTNSFCDRVLGFLSGSAAAGAAVYYYILSEYRTANEMLSEDIYVYLVFSLHLLGF